MKTRHFSGKSALVVVAAITIVGSTGAQAVVLSQWNFNGAAPAINPTSVASGVSAETFDSRGVFGSGTFGASSAVEGVGGTNPFVFGAVNLAVSEATAAHFFDITLTPDAGNKVDFTKISFVAWANAGFTDNTIGYNYFVRSSATGTTTLGTLESDYRVGSTEVPTGAGVFEINLASIPELQNITTATTFTIGVYLDADTSNGNMRIDSVNLEGNISVVPEPSSLMLSAAGAGLLLVRRRHYC